MMRSRRGLGRGLGLLCAALALHCGGSGASEDAEQSATGGTAGSATGGASGSGGQAVSGGQSATGGTSAQAGATGDDDTLSTRYPADVGLAADPAVLFFDDCETGWGRWTAPGGDTATLSMKADGSLAHAGTGYLESTVTSADLEVDEYISSQSHIDFPTRVQEVYLRFHARFVGTAPTPHHWVRMTAGTPSFQGSGLANTVPPGDEGFWFDFDAGNDDVFNFYVYWYLMRSGRCNDGSTEPGCEGDQGTTYHYGNVFQPPEQTPFDRDAWFCIEMHARANTVGQSDGELTFWIDDDLVGDYRPGSPIGTWLRDSFHTGGCDFSACTEPVPFEGFDFRSDQDVLFKTFVLDAYYERGSSAAKREELEALGIIVDDAQTILYDDIVIATERVGCRTP